MVDLSSALSGAYSRRNPQGGTPNFQVPDVVPALIGRTRGRTLTATDEVTTHSALNSVDALDNSNVRRIIRISNTAGGPADYIQGSHYVLNGNSVDWSATTKILTPELETPVVTSVGGGSWGATGAWFFVITALNTHGETLQSTQVTATVAAAGNSVTLRWGRVTGATQYKIYASQVSATYGASSLLVTIANGATTEHIELDGTLAAGQPPVSNTAHAEPAASGTYYVTYEYADYDTLQAIPKRYVNLSDVFNDHGIGSNVAQMAELAMATQPSRGNGAPAVWVVGVENDAAGEYQTALTNLEVVKGEVLLVVMDKRTSTLDSELRGHISKMNGIEERRERIGILWNSPTSVAPTIGDSSTPGTILYDAAQSNTGETSGGEPNGFNMFHIVPDSGGATGLISDTDGVVSETNLSGWHVAAAAAGMGSALPDAATPWTTKPVRGLVNMRFTEYTDSQIKQLRSGGVMVVDNVNGAWRISVGATVRQNGLEEEKFPNIAIADKSIAMLWRDEIDPPLVGATSRASLIGRKISDGLIEMVRERTISALDRALQRGLARNYDENAISVTQGDGVSAPKTQIDVSFSYQAYFPSLVIVSERSFDTNQSG